MAVPLKVPAMVCQTDIGRTGRATPGIPVTDVSVVLEYPR